MISSPCHRPLQRIPVSGMDAASEPAPTAAHEIADVELTTSGSVLGTPAYMAPEQFSGGNVDPRTDQFNFCASLYEALYGERPFPGAKFDELAGNVIGGKLKPPPPGTQVSGGLRAIVVRGLSPKPSERFPSMDHLLAELGRDRARPWRRASIGAAALAAALVLGLVAGTGIAAATSKVLRTALYGINNLDPLSYASAIFVLIAIIAIAALLPARHALRVDLAKTLHCD